MRIDFRDSIHHMFEHDVIGIRARTARGLDDHRRIRGIGGGHDRQSLLHVIDIKGRNAIVMLGGVIEKLTQGDAGHGAISSLKGLVSN